MFNTHAQLGVDPLLHFLELLLHRLKLRIVRGLNLLSGNGHAIILADAIKGRRAGAASVVRFGANLAGKGQDVESSLIALLCTLLVVNSREIALEKGTLWTADSV